MAYSLIARSMHTLSKVSPRRRVAHGPLQRFHTRFLEKSNILLTRCSLKCSRGLITLRATQYGHCFLCSSIQCFCWHSREQYHPPPHAHALHFMSPRHTTHSCMGLFLLWLIASSLAENNTLCRRVAHSRLQSFFGIRAIVGMHSSSETIGELTSKRE